MITVPKPEELSDYYKTYLKYVDEGDNLLKLLLQQATSTQDFLSSIPSSREDYAYAPGKWMLKEVVGHLCDTERILNYRALRISKGDQTPISGFDENTYMDASNFKTRPLKSIAAEYRAVRFSTIFLFENFSPEMVDMKGTANNTSVSVRALLFFIVAHERHHLGVIRERYL